MATNDRLEQARTIITSTGASLFLTGKAGTGKTTFLKNLRDTCRKRMIVTAPTGIAAINAGGVTLHSFFQLDFVPFVPGMRKKNTNRHAMAFSKEKIRIIRGLDLIVIDEVSMVRADMLDAVDDVLRRYRDRTLPFGGVQLLLIGDLQQLPPVVKNSEQSILEAHYRSPFFFDSHALQQLDYVTIELTEIYRQTDREFIDILNAVRNNRVDSTMMRMLNTRCMPGFNPPDSAGYIRLTTHNHLANEINGKRMAQLEGEPHYFKARVEGNFPESSFPADRNLELKEGAQVMFIKNDSGADRRFFNGMLGRVTAIDEEGVTVTPVNGEEQITVEPMEWENVRYVVNEETKEIAEVRDGAFRQLPLKPAWAITIHKSQGLTFDKAIIDATLSFTHGQTYVALSRCRTLEGMVLERPLSPTAIITNPLVSDYMSTHITDLTPGRLNEMTYAYKVRLIEGMFNFRPMFNALEGVIRLLKENFIRIYGEQISRLSQDFEQKRISMTGVGDKFCCQVRELSSDPHNTESAERLLTRVKDACRYFNGQMNELQEFVTNIPRECDNRKVNKKMEERMSLFRSMASVCTLLFTTFSNEDFSIERYLDVKAGGTLSGATARRNPKSTNFPSPSPETSATTNPELFAMLCEWRENMEELLHVPYFSIISTKILGAIAEDLPLTLDELLTIPGMSISKVNRMGDELLEIVRQYIVMYQVDISGSQAKPARKTEQQAAMPSRKQQKPKKEKAPRPKKGDSARKSLEMWNSGLSFEDIAKERSLAISTITGHILEAADLKDPATKRRLIDADTEEKLRAFYDTHPSVPQKMESRIEEIEKSTGAKVTPVHIRLVEKDYPNLIRLSEETP